MSLLDFFKRPQATEAASPDGDAAVVLRARAHARRRLIGAAVLLTLGVLGFPLLFETRPRPIPVDIPIELPAKDGASTTSVRPRAAGPVVMEPASTAAPAAAASSSLAAATAPKVTQAVQGPATAPTIAPRIAPTIAPAPATAAASTAVVTLAASAAKPAAPPASAAAPKPAATAAVGAAVVPSAALAAAPASATANARYVVQVGAFADANAARAARLRVEKLGLKTFTQEIQKDGALRIRVRVGPYPTKAEAEKAAKTIQKGDLPAAVLLL